MGRYIYNLIKNNVGNKGESIGDWKNLNVYLYTPTLTWIEANYIADLRLGETADIKEYFYQKYLSPYKGIYFLVKLSSYSKEALKII